MQEQPLKFNIKEITNKDKESFKKDGFIILENILPINEQVDKLYEKSKSCFYYGFDQGITPDEMTWRPNVSNNDVTRELINVWKTDSLMASLVLNEELGKLACELLECDSVRIGQDNIFWKPKPSNPNTENVIVNSSIGYHQDQPYLGCFLPYKVLTMWIALTDVSKENGTLELVRSSHNWDKLLNPDENPSFSSMQFHAPNNYRLGVQAAANKQGFKSLDELDIHYVQLKKGGCSIHHGMLWHGSGSNSSSTNDRLSIGIHFIPGECTYNPDVKAGFAFGRYKLFGSNKLEETFYPITYSKNGYKSPIINHLINNKDSNFMSLLD